MTNRPAHPVVITRPLAQAQAFAQRVSAAGREAVVFPLLEIHSLADQTELQTALRAIADYALVVFVSPNAIDAAFAWIDHWPKQVAIGVVGEGSKAALARHGLTANNATIFSPVDPRRTDSQTLLETLDFDALRGKRVLIVRGESGREFLADALRDKGVIVDKIAAYRRAAPVLDQAARERLIELIDGSCDWVLTSSEALRVLLQLVRDVAGDDGVAKMQQQKVVVPHVRIAETAHSLGFTHVLQTGSGDEQLVAALQFQA